MKFSAHTVRGSGRGKDLNVPTINLQMDEVPDGMEDGLYACMVNDNLPGVLHYGIRPTFEDTPSCEVHIIDQHIPDPPEKLSITVIQKIRETITFSSAEELMVQMQKDIDEARGILNVS